MWILRLKGLRTWVLVGPWESNPRPPALQSNALLTELILLQSKAEHLSSFWYRGPGKHGNGLLKSGIGKYIDVLKTFWWSFAISVCFLQSPAYPCDLSHSFLNKLKLLWGEISFQKFLIFRQIMTRHQDCPIFTIFLIIKTLSQNISITLSQILSKLHKHQRVPSAEKYGC